MQVSENEMVRCYANLAFAIAREFYTPGTDREDIKQEALIGLLKAIRTYEPALSSFKTFANLCVRRHLIQVLIHAKRIKRTPEQGFAPAVQGVDGGWLDAIDQVEALDADPVDVLTERNEVRRIVSVIRYRMTPFERESLLGMLNGVPYAEMEGVANSDAVKRVDNAIQRARRKLRAAA